MPFGAAALWLFANLKAFYLADNELDGFGYHFWPWFSDLISVQQALDRLGGNLFYCGHLRWHVANHLFVPLLDQNCGN
jgi:hypothetical protein